MSKEVEDSMSYEDFYRSSFEMITNEAKMTITCGFDLHKKENEVARYDRHRKAKTAVLANAYSCSACYHPNPNNKTQMDIALTYFPLVLPRKLDKKPVPLYLQHIGGIYWRAVKLKNSSSNLPLANRVYFNSHPDNSNNYNLYWNKWGQFPEKEQKKRTKLYLKTSYG
ncbi:hypothetical protein EDC96DRAFT_496439 [Choanephora cucurbitarum]|nr:hypothetical protein EDC96DRAFT_496439 [Choanephora cucurbitarum]